LKIVYSPLFSKRLTNTWDYIAKDSISSAMRFRNQLQLKIETIPNFPYKSRQSFYYDDENIRDYIFKGYTIPYLIDLENNELVILDIFKWINK